MNKNMSARDIATHNLLRLLDKPFCIAHFQELLLSGSFIFIFWFLYFLVLQFLEPHFPVLHFPVPHCHFKVVCIYDCPGVKTVRNWDTGIHIPCEACWQQWAVCSENGNSFHCVLICVCFDGCNRRCWVEKINRQAWFALKLHWYCSLVVVWMLSWWLTLMWVTLAVLLGYRCETKQLIPFSLATDTSLFMREDA